MENFLPLADSANTRQEVYSWLVVLAFMIITFLSIRSSLKLAEAFDAGSRSVTDPVTGVRSVPTSVALGAASFFGIPLLAISFLLLAGAMGAFYAFGGISMVGFLLTLSVGVIAPLMTVVTISLIYNGQVSTAVDAEGVAISARFRDGNVWNNTFPTSISMSWIYAITTLLVLAIPTTVFISSHLDNNVVIASGGVITEKSNSGWGSESMTSSERKARIASGV